MVKQTERVTVRRIMPTISLPRPRQRNPQIHPPSLARLLTASGLALTLDTAARSFLLHRSAFLSLAVLAVVLGVVGSSSSDLLVG